MFLFGVEVQYNVTPPNRSGEPPCRDTIASKQLFFASEQAEETLDETTDKIKERLAVVFPKGSDINVRAKVAIYKI